VAIGLVVSAAALAGKPVKPPPPDQPASYTLVDLLGIPGGNFLQSEAHAVSQPDQAGSVFVAGNSYVAGAFYPVRWAVASNGSLTGPLDLGGPPIYVMTDVNDAGVVVTASGHVFVPGLPMQELPRLGAVDAHASAVNNLGQIAGWLVFDDGTTREAVGALWELDGNGVPGDPDLLGDFLAYDISDTGVMAGEIEVEAVAAIAWFDANGLQVQPLGALPGYAWSKAEAISANGVWVAGACRNGPWEAFVWSEATGMIGLGRFGGVSSEAYGVNNAGQVVGISSTNEGRYAQTAFLWKDVASLGSGLDI
jgi:probable HAF family extracellular repeat protein